MKLCSLLTASKEFQLVLRRRDIKGVTVNTQRCKAIIPWLQEECRGSQNALVFSKPLPLAKNWNFHQLCCQGTYNANIHRTLELEKPLFSAHVEFLAEAECDEQMRKIWEAGWIFLDPHRIFGNGNNLKLTWAHTLGGFSLYARSSITNNKLIFIAPKRGVKNIDAGVLINDYCMHNTVSLKNV